MQNTFHNPLLWEFVSGNNLSKERKYFAVFDTVISSDTRESRMVERVQGFIIIDETTDTEVWRGEYDDYDRAQEDFFALEELGFDITDTQN